MNLVFSLLQALKRGPIMVAVDSGKWPDYAGGIFTDSDGCTGMYNHAVLLVGAGVDPDTQEPYWLIRNSWGKDWGEWGHIR